MNRFKFLYKFLNSVANVRISVCKAETADSREVVSALIVFCKVASAN